MQNVKNSSPDAPRRPRTLPRLARIGLVATAGALGACTGLADLLTPGQRNDDVAPAMLSFQANVALASNHGAGIVTLDVRTTYLRRDGTEVPVSSQSLRLSNAELQPVPIPVDVATCLADPEREGNSGSCAVMLNLALQIDGATVDRQVIGPIRLTPGLPAVLPNAVTLFEIAEVAVLDAQGVPLPADATLSLTPGATRTLTARVSDSRGTTVPERPVTWRSDAPQVASISSAGVITAISEGTARFSATLGGLSASVSATIARPPVAFTVTGGAGTGRGSVRSTPAGIDCRIDGSDVSGTCSAVFPVNARVTLRSVADERNRFAAWGDACSTAGTADECTVTLENARQATVRFHALRTLSVVASAESDGQGRIQGSGLDCRLTGTSTTGTCTVDVVEGADLALSASPASEVGRQTFAGWSGACADRDNGTCTVSARGGDLRVVAGFFDARALSVALQGSGDGAVRGLPDDVACARVEGGTQGACAAKVEHGRSVTLSVEPDARSEFVGWAGACTGTVPTCTVALTAARAVTATFARRRAPITVALQGAGGGAVLGLPDETSCARVQGATQGACTALVELDQLVMLRAVPDAISAFTGWGGACTGTQSTCTVTITAARSVTATFAPRRVPLTVTVQGTGGGAVVGLPDAECALVAGATEGACATTVEPGSSVTLRAVPDARSTFTGWTGACTASESTCTVALTEARSVTATFARRRVLLTVAVAGPGAGVVRLDGSPFCTVALSAPATTCTRQVDAGAQILLTGVPSNTASRFVGFSGACAGVNSCLLTIDAPLTVSAAFGLIPVSISIVPSSSASTGSGRVVDVARNGIDCRITLGTLAPDSCAMSVNPFTPVRLTAQPEAASALMAWGEACASATTTTCTLTPTAATTVSARFTAAIDVQMIMTLSTGAGSVTFEVPGIPAQPTCTSVSGVLNSCRFSLPIGATGVFRGVAAPGSRFVGFSGPCLEGTGPVPVCTYRGFGFVREIEANFERL